MYRRGHVEVTDVRPHVRCVHGRPDSDVRLHMWSARLVHSWDIKRIYSYSRVFPIGGEWGAYSPAVFGRFGRFWYSAVSGFRPFLGGM